MTNGLPDKIMQYTSFKDDVGVNVEIKDNVTKLKLWEQMSPETINNLIVEKRK